MVACVEWPLGDNGEGRRGEVQVEQREIRKFMEAQSFMSMNDN